MSGTFTAKPRNDADENQASPACLAVATSAELRDEECFETAFDSTHFLREFEEIETARGQINGQERQQHGDAADHRVDEELGRGRVRFGPPQSLMRKKRARGSVPRR